MSRLLSMVFAGVVMVGGLAGAVRAESWPDTLFTERSHDFGPVPRGGIVRHPFVLTNHLTVPIQVLNLRVSCGCTSGTASAKLVPPGKSAIIEAQMDTRNFVGRKSTTLFVSVLAGGRESEIGLGVSSLILSDVVLNPGAVDFGTVGRGQTPAQVLTIDRVGKPDWKVVRMVSASKVLNASLQETKRSNGEVGYRLNVSIKPEVAAGIVRDEIRLVTNDPETPGIPILVTAQIQGDLSATPTLLPLGDVTSAAGVQGRYIVRGSKPFAIAKVEGTGDGFELKAADSTRKPLHVLTLTYNPALRTSRGDQVKTFRIVTDLPGEAPLDVSATLHVEP
jgi:Protein of unknown function (DUF1573)